MTEVEQDLEQEVRSLLSEWSKIVDWETNFAEIEAEPELEDG